MQLLSGIFIQQVVQSVAFALACNCFDQGQVDETGDHLPGICRFCLPQICCRLGRKAGRVEGRQGAEAPAVGLAQVEVTDIKYLFHIPAGVTVHAQFREAALHDLEIAVNGMTDALQLADAPGGDLQRQRVVGAVDGQFLGGFLFGSHHILSKHGFHQFGCLLRGHVIKFEDLVHPADLLDAAGDQRRAGFGRKKVRQPFQGFLSHIIQDDQPFAALQAGMQFILLLFVGGTWR